MSYMAHIVAFTLKHVCVLATWYNTHLSEHIRVGIGFIIHISKKVLRRSTLTRRIQVTHKYVHAFVRVKDVSRIP